MWKLLPLVILLVAGCAPKNPYLGIWKSEVTIQGFNVAITHRFAEQGAYSADLKTGDITGELKGSYAYEGERLTITPSAFSLDTSKAGLLGKMAEQFKPDVEAEMKKPQAGKVAWSDSGFTVTPDAANVPQMAFAKVPTN
jgi:hypothetical protein